LHQSQQAGSSVSKESFFVFYQMCDFASWMANFFGLWLPSGPWHYAMVFWTGDAGQMRMFIRFATWCAGKLKAV
jgi:hypothetical protein